MSRELDTTRNCQARQAEPGAGKDAEEAGVPRSVQVASGGIRTSQDAANFLSALIGDVMADAVAPRKASVANSAMGNLLRLTEMQHKYGKPESQDKTMVLVQDNPSPQVLPPATQYGEKVALLRRLSELGASDEEVKRALAGVR